MVNQKGQSTIEFLMVSVFAFGILTLFIQLAFNLTSGYLVHYATYMSSRTYSVWDEGSPDPDSDYINSSIAKAEEVFSSYNVRGYGGFDSEAELIINTPGSVLYEFVGSHYSYTKAISIFSYFGGNIDSLLVSESFLGKEPTRSECWSRVQKANEHLAPGDQSDYITLFDNGC